ncbi:ATP-binding protein [Fluviispira multicolorata]|uniref:Sensory/regulatory protein RpfC n=1 Tax=Fluviispira multicolorata TaxID=2654512 RepID=A0A833MZY6_9BACT|nr:ATP-binding protein [Fluviispira multicolorata]KAB8027383.1 response regulator [Fluviispira multicolorata]
MLKAPIGKNEEERQKTLENFFVLDTDEEEVFNDITQLASAICQTPISLISLVDSERQWFKSSKGLCAKETPRDISFCGHAIQQKEIFEIQDARADARFFDNPFVTEPPHIRFYAGAPLIASNGHSIGTLCVIDSNPKILTDEQKRSLENLSKHIINILELRILNTNYYKINNHFNNIFQNITNAMVIQNKNGKFYDSNQAALNILEISSEQLKNMSSIFSNFTLIDEHENTYQDEDIPPKYSLKTGENQRNILIGLKNKSGKIRWIRMNISLIFIPKETKPIFVIYEFEDITAQKNMADEVKNIQKEILDQRIFLDIILQNIPSGIVVKDMKNDLRITIWNKGAENLLMLSADETLGKTAFELYPKKMAERALELDLKAFKTGNLIEIEAEELEIPNKEKMLLHTRKLPLITDLGEEPRYMLTIFDDVTEIYKAKEAALTAVKSKSEFLANMSHEIRTPMNGIIGMCRLLLESSPLPEQIERLKIIQNCGYLLLDLINNILDFSKIEAQKIEVENITFLIKNMIHEITELFSAQVNDKKLSLSYSQDLSVPEWISGDPTKIRQILMNLISNAIKFTQNGFVKISSNAKKIEDKKFKIEITVEDSGFGISKDAQHKLFKEFSQVDASSTRKFGGSGLGLAICKGLCEKMGGTIWVESDIGKGSKFIFNFIATQSDNSEVIIDEYSRKNIDKNLSEKHPLNILIAEDNKINQQVVFSFLEKLGYKADIAENGNKVLEYLKKRNYDLILMDCHMPELDGFETTKAINKKFKNKKRPRILALTASNLQADIDKCFASGMDGYISKPIILDVLIKNILDNKEQVNTELNHEKNIPNHLTNYISFNRKNFLTNFQGMNDLAIKTIDDFLIDLPKYISKIKKSIQKNDSKELEISAHTLNGILSYFYAEKSRYFVKKLEEMGQRKKLISAQEILTMLNLELVNLKKELIKLKKELS